MSERGSFVTQYIYCDECLEAARKILYRPSAIFGEKTTMFPIIAGKISGMYSQEELRIFEFEVIPQLEKVICHEMRIAVLAEIGERIFTVKPSTKKD